METNSPEEKKAWLKEKSGGRDEENPKSYKKSGRTTLEKLLLVLVVVFFVALVAVIVVLIVEKSKDEPDRKSAHGGADSIFDEVCITQECVSAAARIHSYIDYSVKPCDNLYEFACGRWMKENVVPEHKSSCTTFSQLRDQVDIRLKALLEEDTKPGELNSITKSKTLYKSCMNYDMINERGDKPLESLMTDVFGGWPLTTSGWKEANFDLTDTVLKLDKYGSVAVFILYAGVDSKNSSRRNLKMDQPSFGMPGQKYYLVPRNDTMLMAYEDLIYKIGKIMGFAGQNSPRDEVKAIVDFEIELAKISVPDEDRRDMNSMYNPMTLGQVHGNYSKAFDWRRFVRSVLTQPEVGVQDLTDNEIIINRSPLYYERLTGLLGRTPKRTLANYLIWRLVYGLVGTQGEPYAEVLRQYRKILQGVSSEQARYVKCVSYTTYINGLSVGRLFVKDSFDASAKTMALEMIGNLRAAFTELLEDLDWMDESTKKVANEKKEYISPKIGYPEDIMNNTYLDEYYSNYTYHKGKYFENVLMNRVQGFYDSFRKLREPVDKEKWQTAPSSVNAFYNSLRNQIMFPAGILQPPFFSKTYPKSVNFGGIGFLVGHEMIHAFDDRGRQFDKNGNLVQWWSQTAIDRFKNKAQCLVDQYGNFTLPQINMNLNGINTQGENIADNGGLKQSFRAYRNWVAKQGHEEAPLPGVPFTHNQLFFINFAQLWCNLLRDESALNKIRTGVHSPGRFRVIGSAQNSPDFQEAFDCPRNSYMNPPKKCSIW